MSPPGEDPVGTGVVPDRHKRITRWRGTDEDTENVLRLPGKHEDRDKDESQQKQIQLSRVKVPSKGIED
jgi:hypothetical protein